MKKWNFKIKNSPKENSQKLKSALETVNGLVFNLGYDKNNAVTFKMRKRVLYAWYWMFQNWTTVSGKLLKMNSRNKTNVEIYFNQHLLIRLIVFTNMFLGLALLIAIITGISKGMYMFIFSGILLVLGIILWIALQKKFEKDIQNYKTLISKILEP
ncbi:MAG: DUF423 domain-containing protein [Maribacter sp.]